MRFEKYKMFYKTTLHKILLFLQNIRIMDQLLKLFATFIGLSRLKQIWNHLLYKCVY
jgi:hypothetical protein